ncbi:peptide ABC transporter substrate-binding protein [Staphylospora marina]|uniref:peptide ABC transporter substrate-binding protein n=1 Tax=Staphylospora marina TaxID=2490858 RepID=UPI000F5BFBA4|nr:peptide ABC transporter substrate-binding protein [Staphylospora marina]
MKSKRWKFGLGIAVSLSLLVSGCNLFQGGGSSRSAGLAENQVLKMAETTELITLDSAKVADMSSFNILNNVMEGLMRSGKGKQPEYGIATEYKVSPDKKQYTFTLREDAEWSDGKPVTAHDFEYAWKRALDPNTASEYAYILYMIKNAEKYNNGKAKASDVGVRALDDKTLEVTLERPSLNFLSVITLPQFMPQRKDIVEKYKNEYGTKVDKVVYNGPFTLTSWSPSKLVLVKNANYWEANSVTLEKVEIHIVKDPATSMNLYTANEVDISPLSSALAEAFKKSSEFNAVENSSTFYILFNHEKSIFKNEKIRKAISLAIDRDEFEKLTSDGSKGAGSLVPTSIKGRGGESFRVVGEVVRHDTDKARQLLQEGLSELGLSKPPSTIEMITFDTSPRKEVAINIKEQLRTKLGLNIQLNAQPGKIRLDRVKSGDFQMAMYGWGADYDDPMTFFDIWMSDNGMNHGKFKNAEYDALVKKAMTTTNSEEYVKSLVEAEKILVGTDARGKAAMAPLFYGAKAFMEKPYVKDLYRHSAGAEYSLKWAYIAKQN